MRATPETVEALRALALQGEVALGIELHAMALRVRAVVPELIGLSLGVIDDGITLTLVASEDQLAALDAVQYLDGGPCVAVGDSTEPVEVSMSELLDEDRWQLYAQASAATGVASSLSLPIVENERVVGTVNLYASTPNAFAGLHESIAWAVGSDAALAVTNADLGFRTRERATEAAERVRERPDINISLGIIAATHGVSISEARERLRSAAARAGISEAQAARAIRFVRGR